MKKFTYPRFNRNDKGNQGEFDYVACKKAFSAGAFGKPYPKDLPARYVPNHKDGVKARARDPKEAEFLAVTYNDAKKFGYGKK